MSLYHKKEECVKIKESSLQLACGGREMRIPLLRIPSFPRIVIPPYRHFERSEKSSLHTGKAKIVR